MSQDEEKHSAPPVEEEEEGTVVVTALHELNERFEMFTGQILVKLDAILEMKSSVDKLLQATNWKRAQDAERKRVQRARDAEAKNRGLLPLENNIWSRRESLKPKYLEWAHIGIQFGVIGDALLFLQYVAADWCHSTFKKKPITKVSNRPCYWSSGMRCECTWTDMFGRDTGINPKTFNEPVFWEFCSHMSAVLKRLEIMPDWPNVSKHFVKIMQVSCSGQGGFSKTGQFQKGDHVPFDHNEPGIAEIPAYRDAGTRVMQAFRRGIQKGTDHNLELVRIGKLRCADHVKQLKLESARLNFMFSLRKGALSDEDRDQIEQLEMFGFKPSLKVWQEPEPVKVV